MGKRKFMLDAETATRVGSRTYFFGKKFNILYYIDDDSERVCVVGSIPKEPVFSQRLVGRIVVYKHKIILVPLMGKRIWILDLECNEWESVELRNTDKVIFMFFHGHLYENTVHMIGCEYPYVVCFNCDDYSIEYDNRIFEELKNKEKSRGDIFFRSDYVREGNEVRLGCCCAPYFLKYNLENREYVLIKQMGLADYENIMVLDDCEVYSSRSEKKIMIKRKLGESSIVEIPDNISFLCGGIKRSNECIYLLSNMTGDSREYSEKEGFKRINRNYCMFVNDGATMISMDTNGVAEIEGDGTRICRDCFLERDIMISLLRDSMRIGGIVQESIFDLEDLLCALT